MPGGLPDKDPDRLWELTASYGPAPLRYMFVRNESESFRFQPRSTARPQWIDKADPTNRNSSTGGPPRRVNRSKGFCAGAHPALLREASDLVPIHAGAETVAEKKWFRDAYRRRRCIVPMDSFFQKHTGGKRYVISRRDGQPFGVTGIEALPTLEAMVVKGLKKKNLIQAEPR